MKPAIYENNIKWRYKKISYLNENYFEQINQESNQQQTFCEKAILKYKVLQ